MLCRETELKQVLIISPLNKILHGDAVEPTPHEKHIREFAASPGWKVLKRDSDFLGISFFGSGLNAKTFCAVL
jgi:hypothetical protein